MKKIIVLLILTMSSISISETNREIIDRGNQRQKDIFDKYYRNTSDKYKRNNEVLKGAYSELLYFQFDKNKAVSERELKRLKGSRRAEFKKMFDNYNLYVSVQAETSKELLETFLREKGEMQSYMFVNTYNLFEAFDLNMNTFLEGEKDRTTVEPNVKTLIDFYYFSGDEKSKDDYMKMSNEEMRRAVEKEFIELNNEIDRRMAEGTEREKKGGKSVKSKLAKLEKAYNSYDRSFEIYIDGSGLNPADRDYIKKTVKYENIANLRFFKQTLEIIKEGENNEQ